MALPDDTLTDQDLCELLKIKPRTLRALLQGGPPKAYDGDPNMLDVRDIRHVRVGRRRLWSRQSALALINKPAQESERA